MLLIHNQHKYMPRYFKYTLYSCTCYDTFKGIQRVQSVFNQTINITIETCFQPTFIKSKYDKFNHNLPYKPCGCNLDCSYLST